MKLALFKAESDSFGKYFDLLQANVDEVELIPTIDFNFKNADLLAEHLQTPNLYGGIVFTSPRCVQAVKLTNSDLTAWQSKSNFSIGETTYNEALALGLETTGKDTGNAKKLSELIRRNYSAKQPLLYPCGNLKQDTLMNELAQARITLKSLEVYETVQYPTLETNIKRVLKDPSIEYLVFFSPSGVNFSHQVAVKNGVNFNEKKLISIGPSTSKAMEGNGWKVFATAKNPTPEELLKTLMV